MSCLTRKSLLAVAVATLVAVPFGAAADSAYKEGQRQDQMRSPTGTSGQVQPGAATQTQRGATSQLQSMTPSQLRGTEVVGSNGEQIGSVKKVVQGRQDGNIHAVISSGGVMGVGDREVTVPLDRLSYEGGKLRMSATADELRASPAYRDEQYVEVQPMDQPISEFSAFETVPDRSGQGRTMRRGEEGSMERRGGDKGSMWDRGSGMAPAAGTGPSNFYPATEQFTP